MAPDATRPPTLFLILTARHWQSMQVSGQLEPQETTSLGPCTILASAGQLQAILQHDFADQQHLVLLTLDPEQFPQGRLAWEPDADGVLRPRLYAELPLTAVARADAILPGMDLSRLPADLAPNGT